MFIYHHNLNPVIFSIGPLAIRWYGLMYAVGFTLGYVYLNKSRQRKLLRLNDKQTESLFTYSFLGIILGARIGYFLLYNFSEILKNPLQLIEIWEGGMSFHGGLIGLLISLLLFCKKHQKQFLQITDLITIPAAIGLGFGRIGNFINGELWGRPTDQTWGVVFPQTDSLLRHPSQLYEAAKNFGMVLLFYSLLKRKLKTGTLSFVFALWYGTFRFLIEAFYREPTSGFIGPLTRGEAYSVPLIIIGIGGLMWLYSPPHTKNDH